MLKLIANSHILFFFSDPCQVSNSKTLFLINSIVIFHAAGLKCFLTVVIKLYNNQAFFFQEYYYDTYEFRRNYYFIITVNFHHFQIFPSSWEIWRIPVNWKLITSLKNNSLIISENCLLFSLFSANKKSWQKPNTIISILKKYLTTLGLKFNHIKSNYDRARKLNHLHSMCCQLF